MEEIGWTPAQQELLQEAEELMKGGQPLAEILGRLAQLLTARMRHFTWAGFYLLESGRLQLGPHSGRDHPPHESSVTSNRGPQGLAAARAATVVQPDLRRSPRWLACPAVALSEIVVPIQGDGVVYAEIDVDGRRPGGIDLLDRRFLEALAGRLLPLFA